MLGYDKIMICAGGNNSQTISDRVMLLSNLEIFLYQRYLFIFCGMLVYDEIMICVGGDCF